MTNAAIQSIVNTYGDRVCAFALNNNKYLLIGYPASNSPKITDIKFESKGGDDMFHYTLTCTSTTPNVEYETYILSDVVETIYVMSEKDKDYRLDPVIFR